MMTPNNDYLLTLCFQGCQVKDHIATVSVTHQEGDTQSSPSPQEARESRILDILLQRRDFICVPPRSLETER